MRLVLIIVVFLAGFALASLLALYSYGRFAEQAQGEPSVRLPIADGETPLDRVIAPLTAERPGQSGLMLLDDNLDAFAVRALTARHAGRSLDLQYYIWQKDLTGRLLAREVLAAADRGVRVRLLLDDINAQGHDRTLAALDAHPNIEVRLYNPSRNRDDALRRGLEMLLRAVSVTRRMHNKAWIVDGRLAVLGGRNIGDAYFDADRQTNFRDLDVVALGPAADDAGRIFDAYWNSRAVIPIGALVRPWRDGLPALRQRLAGIVEDAQALPYIRRIADNPTIRRILSGTAPLHWTAEAKVVSDPPGKVVGADAESWLFARIRPLLTSATAALEIVSPYFVPGETFTAALGELARRGARVAVLTNSLAATDVTAVHGAYARYRKPLIESGVELFELKPYDGRSDVSLFGSSGASLHTKAFTVDGRIGFIGSMNFDPRSVSLNTEMGILFEDAGLVEEMLRIFAAETAPSSSYRVAMESGDIVWHDAAAEPPRSYTSEPGASIWRRLAATLIGLLPIESQL